jgi:FkbM family methyltransferase
MTIVIQIGTNNGDDHVRNLCRQIKPSFVLLVEPFTIHNAAIKKSYAGIANVAFENTAITPTPMESVTLYFADRDGPMTGPTRSYEVTSIVPDHLIKHGYTPSELRSFVVPCKTLTQLFDTYAIKHIDYLFLDVEGIDFEVLKSIDFQTYSIANLQIEFLHLDKDLLISFMAERGYTVGTTLHKYDLMFVKQ